MKKLAIVAAILSVLGAGWAGSTWFAGQQTEQKLQTLVSQTNQLLAKTPSLQGLVVELVDYRRSWLEASGKVRLKSIENTDTPDHPDKPLELLLSIKHGPVVVVENNPHLASAYIYSRLDTSGLQPELRKNLQLIFEGKEPITLEGFIGLGNDLDYQLTVNPASYQDETKQDVANFAGVKLSGIAEFSQQGDQYYYDIPISGKIGQLEFKKPEENVLVLLPDSEVSAVIKGNTAGVIPQTQFKLAIPGIVVKLKDLSETLGFGLNLVGMTTIKGADAEAQLTAQLSELKLPDLPLSNASYGFKVGGLTLEGLKQLRELYTALHPIQQELQLLDEMNAANQIGVNSDTVTIPLHLPTEEDATTESEGDTPASATEEIAEGDTTEGVMEGDTVSTIPDEQAPPESPLEEEVLVEEAPEVQAKRAELDKKKTELLSQIATVVLDKVLQANKSQLTSHFQLENKAGKISSDSDLTYLGSKEKWNFVANQPLGLPLETVLSLLKGSINITISPDLIDLFEPIKPLLEHDTKQYQFNLLLAEDRLVFNNKPISMTELQALLEPLTHATLLPESENSAGATTKSITPESVSNDKTDQNELETPSPDAAMNEDEELETPSPDAAMDEDEELETPSPDAAMDEDDSKRTTPNN